MTTTSEPSRTVRAPVGRAERALAPDLARGSMLLLIALANAIGIVLGGGLASAPGDNGAENGLNFVLNTLVNARAYPMFAVMFGYGIWQLYARQQARGASETEARGVLLRRNAWLVVFGLAHGVLLYFGDFLGAYGIVGLAVTLLLLRRSEKVHRLVFALWGLTAINMTVFGVLAVTAMFSGSGTASVPNAPVHSFSAPDYASSLLDRLGEWPLHTLTVLPFVMIVWLGVWAARRRILEEPGQHRKLLRRTAIVGLGVGFVGGLPTALLSAGVLHVDTDTAELFSMLHGASGMFAGPGYVAVFGLLALRFAGRDSGRVVGALSALGRRSLSGYLSQSIAWLVLLLPFSLHVSTWFGNPTLTAAWLAVLVWLGTVLGARWLESRGSAGPAERLLRRLTYGQDPNRIR